LAVNQRKVKELAMIIQYSS